MKSVFNVSNNVWEKLNVKMKWKHIYSNIYIFNYVKNKKSYYSSNNYFSTYVWVYKL